MKTVNYRTLLLCYPALFKHIDDITAKYSFSCLMVNLCKFIDLNINRQ